MYTLVFFVLDVEFECDERDSEIANTAYHAPVISSSSWVEKQCRITELSILDKVEDLEERVYQASIYTKVHSLTSLLICFSRLFVYENALRFTFYS